MPIFNQTVKGGGTTPTGTITIATNGITDVTNYANADVQVPTTAPALYRAFQNSGGELVSSTTESSVINLSGITTLTYYVLYNAYKNNTLISGIIDMSDVVTIQNEALTNCFYGCSGITGVDLSSLEDFNYGGSYIFGNSGITTALMPNLKTLQGAAFVFSSTGLTTVDIPACYYINDTYATFSSCSSLTTVDISAATVIEGAVTMFADCGTLSSVDASSAALVNATGAFVNTALTTMSFPSFAPLATWYNDRNDALYNMFAGVSNIALHFPSNVQTIVEGLNGYSTTAPFGATAGSVAFDLPATYALSGSLGNLFVRCPKYDTETSMAWLTPYGPALFWTAGVTQPAVNDAFYSNGACTLQTGETIDSILS